MTATTGPAPLSFAHLAALDVGAPDLIDLVAEAGFASTSLYVPSQKEAAPDEQTEMRLSTRESELDHRRLEPRPLFCTIHPNLPPHPWRSWRRQTAPGESHERIYPGSAMMAAR